MWFVFQTNFSSVVIVNNEFLNVLKVWDLRKNDVLYKMRGHTDTVTGFRLSPDGSFLLSNAMDNTGTENFISSFFWTLFSSLVIGRIKAHTIGT